MRRNAGAAANAVVRAVVDYFGDPDNESRSAHLFHDIWSRAGAGLGAHVFIGDQSDPSRTFYGWGPELQRFTGTGGRNGVIYGNIMQGDLANAPAGDGMSIDDPTQRIFADRLRRSLK